MAPDGSVETEKAVIVSWGVVFVMVIEPAVKEKERGEMFRAEVLGGRMPAYVKSP
jgi:hypothetical protein